MRAMGIDLGDARTGLALSDELGMFARSLGTLHEQNPDEVFLKVKQAVEENKVDTVVIGYPKHMNGSVGDRGEKAEAFSKKLSEECSVKTLLWDERLTTVSAHRLLSEVNVRGKKRKNVVDAVSAVLILQGYLDSQKG